MKNGKEPKSKPYNSKKLASESRKQLKNHPILLPYYARTEEGKKDYDGSWNELSFVPFGWKKLFLRMCAKMERHLEMIGMKPTDTYFAEVKEKYGTLRVYLGGYVDDELENTADAAEEESMLYCITCGKPTTMECGYYYLCDDCAKDFKGKKEPLTHKHIPYYTVFDENGKKEKKAYHYEKFQKQWASPSDGKDGEGSE